MIDPAPFVVRQPTAEAVPVVVSIPHTGTMLPADVSASLASDDMRAQPMTDWHLHQLYDFLPRLGVTTIHAVYSRFVVDLNRSPRSRPLYPGRFETGLVPTETFDGIAIFATPPDAALVEQRRLTYHAPYHAALAGQIAQTVARFGRAILLDAHSVASRGNRIHGPLAHDIFLGDRDGGSCRPWLTECLDSAFAGKGLAVARNAPYKGGYITDHYGRDTAVDALQIEMAQRVYMDEDDPAGAPGERRFDTARRLLESVFRQLIAQLR